MTRHRTGRLWRAVAAGALLGALFPLLAIVVSLAQQVPPWSVRSALVEQFTRPHLWIIDSAPLVLALVAGIAAASQWRLDRQARQAIELFVRVVRHGIVIADADQNIVEWSSGAEQLFDYTAREIIGEPLSRLIAENQRARFAACIAKAAPGAETVRLGITGLKRDGRHVDLEVSLGGWETASGKMLGAVLQDVTRQTLSERRLHEVEKNWRDIAENSSDVLMLLDRVGTIVFANRGFQGRQVSELIGTNAGSLLPQSERALEEGLKVAFERCLAFEHESRSPAQSGASWIWSRIAPQCEDGEVVRAVLSLSDVSERRTRDQMLRRLASIVETTKDAVISTDETGKVVSWNQGATELYGWAPSEIIGRNISLLCPPEGLEHQCAVFGQLRDGQRVASYEAVRMAKGERRIYVSISIAATRNEAGAFEGISAVVRDMSHHQEMEMAMEQAKIAAERASELKGEFLANMSHEIRTPLNGVVGMADLLRSTPLSAQQNGYITTLLEASHALRVIVDDVLDFSKIEAGQLSIDQVEFDLMALVSGAVDMFQHAAAQNGTQLQLEVPQAAHRRFCGDPNRIRQVLSNLISNAVKFTKDGCVIVRVSMQDTDASAVSLRVEVQDTGLGIGVDDQAGLFQPFTQGDGSITRRFGGTGLGLSICKRLVELMGGRISVVSELEHGSTFAFELGLTPAQSEAARRSGPPSLLPKQESGWTILVAEDNPINQRVVVAMLQALGCKVDVGADGQQALDLWRHGTYDLILTDCQMPIMSGFEFTRTIRQIEGEMHTPIIAMTAQAYNEDRARCAEAGMDDHLSKPLTQSELKSTLAKWLRLSAFPGPPPLQLAEDVAVDVQKLERLEAELGEGGAELLTGLIESFLLDFPDELERLAAALMREEWHQLVAQTHRLRSSTSNLAADRLSSLLRDFEGGALRQDLPAVQQLLASLERGFREARTTLIAFVAHTAALRKPGQNGGAMPGPRS